MMKRDLMRSTFRPWKGLLLCALFVLSAAGGCGDIEWNWGHGQPRKKRSSLASTEQPKSTDTPDQPAKNGAHRDTPASGHANDKGVSPVHIGFYQLVLLSEPGPAEAPAGMRHVRLNKALARELGEVLALIYIPSGPTGTRNRYVLVYPTELEWNVAAVLAARLDCSRIVDGRDLATDSSGSFAQGLGLLYGTPIGHPRETERLQQAEASLLQALRATDQPALERWAAGMIAGSIAADRLYDYERAERHFLRAETLTKPGMFEQMATIYARARGHIQNGKTDIARQLLTNLIAHFGAFRHAETFERARKTLSALEP